MENISENVINDLENMETTPMTEKDELDRETIEELKVIEKQLNEIIKQLCKITSTICNVITKMNLIDSRLILHE